MFINNNYLVVNGDVQLKVDSNGNFLFGCKYGDRDVILEDSEIHGNVTCEGIVERMMINGSIKDLRLNNSGCRTDCKIDVDGGKYFAISNSQFGIGQLYATNVPTVAVSNDYGTCLGINATNTRRAIAHNIVASEEFQFDARGVEYSRLSQIKSPNIFIYGDESGTLVLENIECDELSLDDIFLYENYHFNNVNVDRVFVKSEDIKRNKELLKQINNINYKEIRY